MMINCEDSHELVCKLNNCGNNIPIFTLENEVKLCRVVDIYDGDSCRVVFEHKGILNKWNIRMNGYDSPEIRPLLKLKNRDEIKKKAIEAKDYLKSLIMNENQLVYLKCSKFDKYGRVLGDIFINKYDTKSVNEIMIDNDYAYEYHGGTKKL